MIYVLWGGSKRECIFGWGIRKDLEEVALNSILKSRIPQTESDGTDRKGGLSGDQVGTKIRAWRKENGRHQFCA